MQLTFLQLATNFHAAGNYFFRLAADFLELAVRNIWKNLTNTDFSMPQDAVYIPVPTPWHRRIRRRGCQTTCIAELLVRRFGGRVVHGLKRSRYHRRQASLSGEGRRQLPLNAFVRSRSFVESERLVLVDDVMTTGTTLQRAEAVLDAERVHRFVVGRVF